MQAKPILPVIQRSEEIPTSGDYQQLYEQGLEWISQYSGALWNNYNLGDPGITILQTLCYALTELSYKTNLPIEDILTKENGKIDYENRFIKPQDILPSSPVTLIDFKKKLIDEIVELKQVYFNLNSDHKINTFTPFLEIKPAFIKKDNKTLEKNIITSVEKILLDYQNVAQLFVKPVVLKTYPLVLKGIINLDASISVEKFIAKLIFDLNNYLSPYPFFHSYEEELSKGKTNDEIFDGPLLKGGFLDDSNFKSKRKTISLQNLMVVVHSIEGVEAVSNIGLEYEEVKTKVSDKKGSLTIPTNEVFYFNLKSVVNDYSHLEIVQNGRSINFVSEPKVNYELAKIIPKPRRQADFDQYLPKGTYRDIGTYYSIQHHFPEIYELNRKVKKQNADSGRNAKNKQLKAYLVLFEQIMANYLAQLSHVSDLFSFDSGRNIYQLAGKTYYFQDLYDVPGIQELLIDVKGYGRQYSERNDFEDWNAYKRDHLNPYRQELMSSIESPETNLVRKNKVLKHLLARFGVKYQHDYLNLNNPGYGNNQTAEVVQISETLKEFPLLSANRARSYFYRGDSINTLYAGFELQAGNQINLNSYYQGITESIYQALDYNPTTLELVYFDATKTHKLFGESKLLPINKSSEKHIEIYLNKKLLIDFPIEDDFFDQLILELQLPIDQETFVQILKLLLDPYQYTLGQLVKQSKGFVFIDNIRLLKKFTFTLEIVEDRGEAIVPDFRNLSIYQLQQIIACIRNGLELNYDCFLDSDSLGKQLLESGLEKEEANSLKQAYDKLKQLKESNQIDFKITVFNDEAQLMGIPIPTEFVDSTVSAIFPRWLALLQEPAYKQFLTNKLRSILPMNARLVTYYAERRTMDNLLTYFNCWMGEIIAEKQENKFRCIRRYKNEETWEILKILKVQYETTQ